MNTITVKAGRVPGSIIALAVLSGTSVFDVLTLAAKAIGEKKGLDRPAFTVNRGEYAGTSGKSVDVPQLNGQMLADKVGDRHENIRWDTPVTSNGDTVLVVPKIQGNQFVVSVARVPGAVEEVAIYDDSDPEGGPDAGTVAAALAAAGITLADDEEVLVNGDVADTDDYLSEDDSVLVQPREVSDEPEWADQEGNAVPQNELDIRADRAAALAEQVTEAVAAYRQAVDNLAQMQGIYEEAKVLNSPLN